MEPIKLDLAALDTPLLKASASYTEKAPVKSFGETIEQAMTNLKDLHNQSSEMMQQYALGEDVDVSEVMISMEKASVATELAMQLRNKVLDGYQEILRIQI